MGRVYLLGGTSNAGKSTCAQKLAQEVGLEHGEADQLRLQLQEAAKGTDPINFFRVDCRWLDLLPEETLEHKIDVAQIACRDAVAPSVRSLIHTERSVIVEGDDLLPEFVANWLRAGAAAATFLIEGLSIVRARGGAACGEVAVALGLALGASDGG